jgi:hypothetical protein
MEQPLEQRVSAPDAGMGLGAGMPLYDALQAETGQCLLPQQQGLAQQRDTPGVGAVPYKSDVTSIMLEIGLYIMTGLLLIFLLEQFIRIGMCIGEASARNVYATHLAAVSSMYQPRSPF